MPTRLAVQPRKYVVLLTLYDSIMILNTSEISALHLSRVTAIFVVDCWQFGPSWMFGLKMELMVCAGLVCGKTEQRCIFHDLKR